MNRILLAFTFVALASCGSKNSNSLDTKTSAHIINGQEVKENALITTSIVGLYDVKANYICTGSLIAPNVVMTAAHCMPERASDMRVVFGNDIDDMMNAREVDVLQEHVLRVTDFKVSTKWNPSDENRQVDTGDIALIKFKGAIPEGYKIATFLPNQNLIKKGTMVTVAGYGVNVIDGEVIDPRKYKNLDQAIEDGEVFCDDDKRNCMKVESSGDGLLRQTQAPISSVQDTEVRLDERKAGTCSGDSGGPAYIEQNGQYYLFGVTSRGSLLCNETGVYTNALEYMQWINDTIKILK
ncbi:MAG TPA: trypsin-like serine protease [Bdellovibrio sp.]|uniref:S1 family peptidase n=1 Tax=Bdellovibrio sp. TaxID=28201 RepID=UPI002F0CE72F